MQTARCSVRGPRPRPPALLLCSPLPASPLPTPGWGCQLCVPELPPPCSSSADTLRPHLSTRSPCPDHGLEPQTRVLRPPRGSVRPPNLPSSPSSFCAAGGGCLRLQDPSSGTIRDVVSGRAWEIGGGGRGTGGGRGAHCHQVLGWSAWWAERRQRAEAGDEVALSLCGVGPCTQPGAWCAVGALPTPRRGCGRHGWPRRGRHTGGPLCTDAIATVTIW